MKNKKKGVLGFNQAAFTKAKSGVSIKLQSFHTEGLGDISEPTSWLPNLIELFYSPLQTDAMKFWLMWKARGTAGLRKSVDVAMEAAEYFLNKIRDRPGFRLVLPEIEGSNVCFW